MPVLGRQRQNMDDSKEGFSTAFKDVFGKAKWFVLQ